jgi:hypothetical protein
MINNTIQSLWIGDELGVMEQMCILSYIANGHSFVLYVYDNILNIPKGTIVKDGNEIINKSEIFTDSFGGFVNFSNLFRFALLYKIGGWWVDMDTVCIKPFIFKEDFVFSSENSDPYKRFVVNTTFIKSKPQQKFLKDCIEFINLRGIKDIHWGELGVNLISRMIFKNCLNDYIKRPEYFCPISGYQLDLLINDSNFQISESTYAIHWWNELLKRRSLNMKFHENSLFNKFKSMYCDNIAK